MRDVNVLIITGGPSEVLFRQLPDNKPSLKRGDRQYNFFHNSCPLPVDVLVVRNKFIKKDLNIEVAPQNTLLMLSEPRSIVNFPRRYRNQFGMLYSCQPEIEHRNIVYGPALLPWFVGLDGFQNYCKYTINYDDLAHAPFPQKTKLLSIITSNKAFTIGHQRRIDFAMRIKERYGDRVDVWGRGFRDFNDKWEALAPYKYTISIENCSTKYYWTEKLSDCFLAGTLPVYYGCTNVADYFPQQAYAAIDIDDFEAACKTIDALIDTDVYSKSIPAIEEAKQLVMGKYNMFSLIADCCDKMDVDAPKEMITLHLPLTALDPINIYHNLVERNILKIKSLFSKRKWNL